MKRKLLKTLLLCQICIFIFSQTRFFTAYADNNSNGQGELLRDIIRESNADNLFSYLPDETRSSLSRSGINSVESISNGIDTQKFLTSITSLAEEAFVSEGKTTLSLFAIVLLFATINSLRFGSLRQGPSEIINIASTACICGALIIPIVDLISSVSNVIISSSNFMLMYVPLMAGLMISAGQTISAGSYYGLMMVASQGITQLSSRIIIPFLNVYTAISVVSSISDGLSLQGICKAIAKVTRWILCFGMSVFVSLLTMKGIISSSADTASSRAVRFAVRSFVPMVGSTLSEAYLSVQGCIKLLKSGVGIVAIISTGFIYLPSLFKCIYWSLMLGLVSATAEIFSLSSVVSLISSCTRVLSTLIAILLCCMSVFIISTALILIIGGGGV